MFSLARVEHWFAIVALWSLNFVNGFIPSLRRHSVAEPSALLPQSPRVPIVVALTREERKNDALRSLITSRFPQVFVVETPCIKTVSGPDRPVLVSRLASILTQEITVDFIAVTSPEAAGQFLKCLEEVVGGRRPLPSVGPLAAVGEGTADVLRRAGQEVHFIPSRADAETLAAELPPPNGNGRKAKELHPTSSL